jgi:hypothetical protein
LKTDIPDDQAAWAYAALREGDGTRVSNAYLDALDPAERAGIEDPFNADVAGATEVVRVLAKAPSVLGEQFVDALLADGGTKALDRAFARPPFGQEHLYDATAFLTGNDPKEVDPPTLQSGESKQATGSLGVLTWLVTLGEHTPPDVAMRAANGWGGDSYVTYEFQKRQCIRASWIGDTPNDVDDVSQALGAWVTAMPPGDSQFNNESGVVTMSSCDPGPNEAISTGKASDAFALVTLRAEAFKRQVAQNVPVDKAWCIADRVASGATVKDAQDPSVLDTPDYATKISQYALDCT